MPKCGHCGAEIERNEISYRDANKGGYRSRSVRLCYKCVDKYDAAAAGQKLMKMIVLGVVSAALVLAAMYLIVRR